MAQSNRVTTSHEYERDMAAAEGLERGARPNIAPRAEPDCPSGLRGCWFPGDRKFDPESGRMRTCCANCGKFEYVWAQERKAMQR